MLKPSFQYKDMADIMEKVEFWGHRICPSMQFDDFLAKTETLGRKLKVKVWLI
jgi:hypothetical protein